MSEMTPTVPQLDADVKRHPVIVRVDSGYRSIYQVIGPQSATTEFVYLVHSALNVKS